MKFNRKKFFDGFRAQIDDTISQEQVDGLEFLLGKMEADPLWKLIPHIAYALATVGHETAWSFQPVTEGYYLAKTTPPDYAGKTTRVKNFQKTLRYYPYHGRGYVQLTWKTNYQKAGRILNMDLVNKPELALDREGAYLTMTYGMHQGWFAGDAKGRHTLSRHISDTGKDYKNARRIINGTDKASLIAGYANEFERILRASKTSAAANNSQSTSQTPEQGDSGASKPEPPPITEGDRPADTDSGAAPGATYADAAMSPQVIDKERPSIFTRVMTGIISAIATGIAGITATCGGNEVANMVARQGAERIVENAERSDLQVFGLVVGYIIIGLGAAILLFWIASKIWEKSSDRANKLNLLKTQVAADKLANTVEFKVKE